MPNFPESDLNGWAGDLNEPEDESPATLRQLLEMFVRRERGLIESRSKGGQSVGRSPSISPSVLKTLEWMLKYGS